LCYRGNPSSANHAAPKALHTSKEMPFVLKVATLLWRQSPACEFTWHRSWKNQAICTIILSNTWKGSFQYYLVLETSISLRSRALQGQQPPAGSSSRNQPAHRRKKRKHTRKEGATHRLELHLLLITAGSIRSLRCGFLGTTERFCSLCRRPASPLVAEQHRQPRSRVTADSRNGTFVNFALPLRRRRGVPRPYAAAVRLCHVAKAKQQSPEKEKQRTQGCNAPPGTSSAADHCQLHPTPSHLLVPHLPQAFRKVPQPPLPTA
jgi:hypothetical protein